MTCRNCGAVVAANQLFCSKCGTEVKEVVNAMAQSSTPMVSTAPSASSPAGASGLCQRCGVRAQTKYMEFYYNIGMLIARRFGSVKGNLCKNCINKVFTEFTVKNLFLGWWGTISLFATAFYMINNVARFLFTLGMQKPTADALAEIGVRAP